MVVQLEFPPQDRAKRLFQALINHFHKTGRFGKTGAYFSVACKKKAACCEEPGHTEATIDLARLAGFAPVGVLVEIMNEDGTMARELPPAKRNCREI